MIKTAAQPPRESIAYIEKAITQYAGLPEDPKVREFGMDMSSRPMEVRNLIFFYVQVSTCMPRKLGTRGCQTALGTACC